MKTSTVAWIVVIALVILGGWYLQSKKEIEENVQQAVVPTDMQSSEEQTDTDPLSIPPVVTLISDAKLGTILVAANGMTLYSYAKDTVDASNCSGTCAVNWPPYTPAIDEPLVAGAGIPGQLATITRTDGSTQFTYKGMPLYFWKNDTKPGDTTGQNVGGVWFIVKP